MIKSYEDFSQEVNEGLNSKSLRVRELFMQAINKVDEDLSIKDFAAVVADIFYQEYGEHNYSTFMKIWNNVKAMHVDDLEED